MVKQKKIGLWLDKDLAILFQKLNYKIHKPLFEHELRFCFRKYNITYIDLSGTYKINPEAFSSFEEATRTISKIILRMRFVHKEIRNITEILDFLEPYL